MLHTERSLDATATLILVFGCIVGLDNEITGIFLVALGTSVPGECGDSVRDVFSVHVLTF